MSLERTFAKLLSVAIFFTLYDASSQAQRAALSPHHVPQVVLSGEAKMTGHVFAQQTLSIGLALPLRNEAELDSLIKQIYDPQSPLYHHYLEADEFSQRFAPTPQDISAVLDWAKSKGFTVTNTSQNRLFIGLQGTAASVQNAFGVELNTYEGQVPNHSFFAADREPTLDLGIPILAVTGLTDMKPPHPHYGKPIDAPSQRSSSHDILARGVVQPAISGSGPNNTYLPSDMRSAYYGTGSLTGAGQTVAIFSFDGYLSADLTLFYKTTGTSTTVPVRNVLVGGYNGACFGFNSDGTVNPNTCDDGEQILDIVNVIGMAPGLKQVLFYEGESATAVLNQMASENTAKVISSSWGGGDFGDASDPAFKQFQAQGQSYLNATGDSGAFDPNTFDPPSADPNITQVGGTSLNTNGKAGPWQSEAAWPESGGGFDPSETIPDYQLLLGVITNQNQASTTLRNAPDVAAEGDFDNSTVISGSFETGFGGTSYATPRWAGYVALANQQSVADGKGNLGFLNPAIYTIGTGAAYKTDFHDIVAGANPPSDGSFSGFSAVNGYDLVTGWGSPNGANLLNAFGGSGATPTYSIFASPNSATISQGGKGSLTVGVLIINGFTGKLTFSVSGLPPGVNASFASSTASGTILTLTASATANPSLSALVITGTSGSQKKTAVLNLTIAPAVTAQQLIVNGGFENGANTAPWNLSVGVNCTISCGETPHSGTWYAWFDGYGVKHVDAGAQQVVLPPGKKTASLSLFLHIDTAEITTTNKNDVFTIQLFNSKGALLTTLASFSNLNAAPGYSQHIYNMDAYIGQAVTIRFTGTENSSLQTSFVVDDVSVSVD